MKIEITNEEYMDFLDLLHIANWVLVSHKTKVDPRIEQYDAIIQKIYARAKDAGRGDLVEFDSLRGKYRPTKAFEDASHSLEFIDEFVDHSFWDELIVRFAERDAARQTGGYEKLDEMAHENRHILVDPLEKKYADEFNERGIDRLEIIEHFGSLAGVPVRTHD